MKSVREILIAGLKSNAHRAFDRAMTSRTEWLAAEVEKATAEGVDEADILSIVMSANALELDTLVNVMFKKEDRPAVHSAALLLFENALRVVSREGIIDGSDSGEPEAGGGMGSSESVH